MPAFSKAYAATFLTIVAIISWLDGAPIVLMQFKQLAQLTLADYGNIIGTIASFLLLNLVVYLIIYWLFYRPICKLINFGFLSCCCVGIMVCVANYFISEYVFGPSIIEYWWLMVIPGVIYGIILSVIYFCYNNGFKNR